MIFSIIAKVIFFSGMLCLWKMIFENLRETKSCNPEFVSNGHWSVLDYMKRMDNEISLLERSKEPVDKTIVLWAGENGLRLNKDGTTTWIKKTAQY